MHCPNCNTTSIRTTETFQQPDKTYRTKKCMSCLWTFTSHEVIVDEYSIPNSIRKPNKKIKQNDN